MFIGRFLFGCGGESFMVANTAFITNWFEGNELAFAFGISMAASTLGRVWNNLMSPYLLYMFNDINVSFLFGFLLCLFCNLIIFFTMWIERRITITVITLKEGCEDYKALNKSSHHGGGASHELQSLDAVQYGCGEMELNPLRTLESSSEERKRRPFSVDEKVEEVDEAVEEDQRQQSVGIYEVFYFNLDFWLLVIMCFICYGIVFSFNYISTSLLMERDYFKSLPQSCHLLDSRQCYDSLTNPAIDCPFGTNYQALLPCNYSSYDPFLSSDVDCSHDEWVNNPCTQEHCQRFNSATWYANSVMSIPYVVTAITSPIFGYFLDKVGFRGKLCLLFPLILIIVHCCFAFSNISPIILLIGQGIAFSIGCAVIWSSVPLTVKTYATGLGFGITTCSLNLGTAVVPLMIATVFTLSDNRYIPNVEYLFIFLSFLGLLACILLCYYDNFYDKGNFR
jgi:MFS family permease